MAEQYKRAGWYPDPDGAAGERWWNGAGWSESRRGGAGAAASAGPVVFTPPPSPQAAVPPVYGSGNPAPQRPNPYLPRTLAEVQSGRVGAMSANRYAMFGFVAGIVSIFGLALAAPIGIVFSIIGIVRGRALKAQGVALNQLVFAMIGLGLSIVGGLIGLGTLAAFFIPFFTAVTSN